ncbi:MAG: hypothetical protein WCG27_08530, partial [Pseudomonadota bacterium]
MFSYKAYLVLLVLMTASTWAQGDPEQTASPLGLQDVLNILQAPPDPNAGAQPDCPDCGDKSNVKSAGEKGGLCKDLYKFTCAPGEYDDGTGVSINSVLAKTKYEAVVNSSKELFKKKFEEILADNKATGFPYFKKVALSTLGLTHAPDCQSTEVKEQKNCTKVLAQGLAEISLKRIFPGYVNSLPAASTENFGTRPSVAYWDLAELERLTQNSIYKAAEENLAEITKKEIIDNQAVTKIKTKVFPGIQELLTNRITGYVKDKKAAQLMIEKIAAITFRGTDCSTLDNSHGNAPSDISVSPLLVPNAFYDPITNTFRYCNGFLLTSQSEFQMAFTIAHELSHSIDPCHIADGPEDFRFKYRDPDASKIQTIVNCEFEYPLSGLITCLRGGNSVGAKRVVDTMKMLEVPTASSTPSTQSDTVYLSKNSPFCYVDEIGESVADWLADDILPDYIQKNYPKLTQRQYRLGYSN